MSYRALAHSLAALALILVAGVSVSAGEKIAPSRQHDGTVVRVKGDTLVMKSNAKDGKEAKEHTHILAENGKVTCDGKPWMLEDLKAGWKIRVTTKIGDRKVAMRVEALNKNEQFENSEGRIEESSAHWNDNPREGTIVACTPTRLLMLARRYDLQVGRKYGYGLAPDAIVTCDGMPCNLQDLKPGQRVRVTVLRTGNLSIATRIEAIEEQSTFSIAIVRSR